MTWAEYADPTAGTTLVRFVYCDRCGREKGTVGHARRGVCADCQSVLRLEGALSFWTRAA